MVAFPGRSAGAARFGLHRCRCGRIRPGFDDRQGDGVATNRCVGEFS